MRIDPVKQHTVPRAQPAQFTYFTPSADQLMGFTHAWSLHQPKSLFAQTYSHPHCPRNKPLLRSSYFRRHTYHAVPQTFHLCAASLLFHHTMPGFSRFYSATEKEAAVCLLRFAPRQSEDASHFSNSNAEQLTQLLNGTTVSSPRPRNEFNQPPFRPKPQVQSVEQLLNASTFSIAHRTVYRDKTVRCESNYDDSHEWQTRSRTPSSDEPSPQKYCLPSPNPSVKASSVSGGSEEGVVHA